MSAEFWAQHPAVAPRTLSARQPVRKVTLLRHTRTNQLPGNMVDGSLSSYKDFYRQPQAALGRPSPPLVPLPRSPAAE